MIAEDVLGSKNSLYGIASDSEDIQIKGDGTITLSKLVMPQIFKNFLNILLKTHGMLD